MKFPRQRNSDAQSRERDEIAELKKVLEARESTIRAMEIDGFGDSWYTRNVGIKAERLSKEDFLGPDAPWRKAVSHGLDVCAQNTADNQAAESTRSRPKALDPKKKVPVTLHEKV